MGRLLCLLVFCSSPAWGWSPRDLNLYDKRHFVELAHVLVMQKKTSIAKKILEQEHDLKGCRAIHRGFGQIESLLDCARFINREEELHLKSPQRKMLIADINLLCDRFVSEPRKLQKIIEFPIFNMRNWSHCSQSSWRQVYLTIYANFDADPAASLGILRQAQKSLGTDSPWALKALALFNPKSESWPRF